MQTILAILAAALVYAAVSFAVIRKGPFFGRRGRIAFVVSGSMLGCFLAGGAIEMLFHQDTFPPMLSVSLLVLSPAWIAGVIGLGLMDSSAEAHRFKLARAASLEVLAVFDKLSGGKEIIREEALVDAVKENDGFTPTQISAIQHVLTNIEEVGHVIDKVKRDVLISVPVAGLSVLPTSQVFLTYAVSKEDLQNYPRS